MLNPIALATAIPQLGLGIYETVKATKGLKNLQGQAMPQYTMSPEYGDYYNQAKTQAQYGYSPQETAAFKQNIAQQQNTGFRQGVQMGGGNMAQALSAGFAAQNLGAMNQFAGQGAALQQQKMGAWGGAAGNMMQQENLINQQKIQHRMNMEQAYGSALKSGLENITGSLTSGLGLGSMMYGQGNKQAAPQAPQNSYQAPVQLPQGGYQSQTPDYLNQSSNASFYNPTQGQQQFNMMPGSGNPYGASTPNPFSH